MPLLLLLITFLLALPLTAQTSPNRITPKFVPRTFMRDSINLSDPCILADSATQTYYMTGTGGRLYTSKDLNTWIGPYPVAETDPNSWMGFNPQIWAAELHHYKGKYYYFATFTNNAVKIDTVRGNVIPRRASHILVSDKPTGPYRPMADSTYLPANQPTLDGTFWVDTDGKPYMIYCGARPRRFHRTRNHPLPCLRIPLEPGSGERQGAPQQSHRWSLPFPHWHRSSRHDMDKLGG